MKLILFFLFLILILPSAFAAGFSPSSLIFNLDQEEQECQTIKLDSDSETINVSDKWAENKDVEWKVSNFNTDSSEHNLYLDYPNSLTDEKEFEVCLSGDKVGEYHGAIIMREEQQGSSVIQLAVWIKVTITEKAQESPQSQSSSSSTTSSGGGGGGSSGIQNTKNSEEENLMILANEKESSDQENSKITGSAISELNSVNKPIILTIIIIVALLAIFFYIKRKN